MNASELKRFIDRVLSDEKKNNYQAELKKLRDLFDTLVNNPGDETTSSSIKKILDSLRKSLQGLNTWYNPLDKRRLSELGLDLLFSLDISNDIETALAESPFSVQPARDVVEAWQVQRKTMLETLNNAASGLSGLGITGEGLDPWAAELAFTLPRRLFDDDFDQFLGELKAIRRIIRAYSELATGSAEEVRLGQLSTSDPQITLSMSLATILAIGTTVKWILDQWKRLEEIRKLRAETRKIGVFSDEEVDELFSNKIQGLIQPAIEDHVTEMIKDIPLNSGRREEQHTDLVFAVKGLFARIERGMIVELRLTPPAAGLIQETEDPAKAATLKAIDELADTIGFVSPDEEPVVALPMPPSTD